VTGGFLFDAFSIILINILLSGDNAVVIALAVKSLDPRKRRAGIALGAGLAAVLRVVLTFFAGELLTFDYVQFLGGVLILWIAVKLIAEAVEEAEGLVPAVSLWHATWLILIADLTMSTDNVLAIAGIAKGNLGLLVFGLGLSIAFVVFASDILARIMDRYRAVIYVGGGILGRVGGDMMLSDPWVRRWLKPSHLLEIAVQIVCAAGVLIAGWARVKRAEASHGCRGHAYRGVGFSAGATPGGNGVRPTLSAIEISE
jgi:YjbE family integral membrane protein